MLKDIDPGTDKRLGFVGIRGVGVGRGGGQGVGGEKVVGSERGEKIIYLWPGTPVL